MGTGYPGCSDGSTGSAAVSSAIPDVVDISFARSGELQGDHAASDFRSPGRSDKVLIR
jgi:hypothetical protein